MVRNNLKSLLIHTVMSFLFIIIYLVFFSGTPKWASEEAANRHHILMMVISITELVIAFILYFLSGRNVLRMQGSLIKNLLSTILVAIFGAIIWVIAYIFDSNILTISQSKLWEIHSLYNGYSIHFIYEVDLNIYIILQFSLLPSIALTLGIISKRSKSI